MRHEDLFYVLALLKVEGVGDVTAKKLLHHFPDAALIFKSKISELRAISGVGDYVLRNLKDKSTFAKAEAELRFIEQQNLKVAYHLDADYPANLKHCSDGPVLLFSLGNIDLNHRKIISIVGTRQITAYGQDFCRNLIADLAPLDPIIVSGFAYGVDIAAHQAAVDNGLQTIGILAHGLNQIYPKAHQKYVPRILKNGGLMTEFWSTSSPERENFIRRNRIVAGISEATIVIESADKGGSLITANMANGYHREVFAVPGRASDKYSQGCNNLIKTQKAQLITDAADLIYHLNWDLKPKAIQQRLFIDMNHEEQKIYDFLLKNGKELLDLIAIECELPIFKVSGLLLNMELKGLIRPLPGKYFEAI
ncbi:DNA-protecting protein DprA [Flavobacterium sp. CYK-4]|uniref:DNA-processing protein DprA n=1 Tax=Flavobacterium lotistagni TaxID=2709660 RepID=UPI00140BB27E|nr:DNA-processing protein DprA [Flavobacterium lotistagni]NHM07879.1 DNA-protecting protein DprA [Flavobacterium lotistagni]